MIELAAVPQSAAHLLPKLSAVAGWMHRRLSCVHQESIEPISTERGVEWRDVDEPLECSLALGDGRFRIAEQQFQETLPWTGGGPVEDVQQLRSDLIANRERLRTLCSGKAPRGPCRCGRPQTYDPGVWRSRRLPVLG